MERKKRKVDSENRSFLTEWTELYCFTLPIKPNAIPVCLICHRTVAVFKSANLKRHYETHKEFIDKYKIGSELRKTKIENLKASYVKSTNVMVRAMTGQEKATEAALRVSWVLNKNQKPFTDSEVIKDCMMEVATALFDDKNVADAIRGVPLSARSNTRRTEILANDNKVELIQLIHKSPCYAIAVDESCDIVDTEQMTVFVRYFDEEKMTFNEDLLTILPLKSTTRGEDLFEAIDAFMKSSGLDYAKLVSLTTDGAPAMIAKRKGLAVRIKEKNENLISYHCIIHQSVLCAKLTVLKERMDKLIKLINFIIARSSLQHREFKEFLDEVNAQYNDLLLHNNVRWLSKGQVLQRFWALRKEISTFLETLNTPVANDFQAFLQSESEMLALAFLSDILGHLNTLNTSLQGSDKLICDLIQNIKAFTRKLNIFETDLISDLLQFPTLAEYKITCESDVELTEFCDFIRKLKHEFENRFHDFTIIDQLAEILKHPFTLNPTGEWSKVASRCFYVSQASLQLEIVDFQEDTTLKTLPSDTPTQMFWAKYVSQEKYPGIRKVAIHLCVMFGSTYICESSFSRMNNIKNKFRSKITDQHLQDVLRISCTKREPNFKKLAQQQRCNFSH